MQHHPGFDIRSQGKARTITLAAVPVAVIVAAMGAAGCSASRDSARAVGSAVRTRMDTLVVDDLDLLDDEGAIAAVRKLEAFPLDSAAADLRVHLFAWLVASPALAEFGSGMPPFDELPDSAFHYSRELYLQYLFGSAAWIAGGGMGDVIDRQEAGLRSMIAAYRSIVQLEPAERSDFLDNLDNLRRRGELRSYLQQIHNMKRTR